MDKAVKTVTDICVQNGVLIMGTIFKFMSLIRLFGILAVTGPDRINILGHPCE